MRNNKNYKIQKRNGKYRVLEKIEILWFSIWIVDKIHHSEAGISKDILYNTEKEALAAIDRLVLDKTKWTDV